MGVNLTHSKIIIIPLDFILYTSVCSPKDPGLHLMVQEWCEKQFGYVPSFAKYRKIWVAVEPEEPGLEHRFKRVIGLLCTRLAIDVPILHIERPLDDAPREEWVFAKHARDGLISRCRDFWIDNDAKGEEVTVYISPEAKTLWEPFLKAIGAEDANRVTVVL